jgi:hypothetical protein
MTVTLTPVSAAIPVGGTVQITLFGFGLAFSRSYYSQIHPNLTFVSPSGATGNAWLDYNIGSGGGNSNMFRLTVVLLSGNFPANVTISFTLKGFTNPSAGQGALTNVAAATTTASGQILDSGGTGTYPAIVLPTNNLGTAQPAITLSDAKAGASSVTMNVTITPATASPAGSKVVITLSGYGLNLATSPAPVVTFLAPSGATGNASLTGSVLAVTLL